MSAEASIEPEGVDAAAFASQVKQVSDSDLKALMESEMRGQILDEIFRRMVEHFRPARAEGVRAVIHWKILDRPGGGYDHYEFVIEDGAAALNQPPARDATLEFRIKPVHFLKLVTGNAQGPLLFMTGKLKIKGDLALAARAPGFFEIPKG
jgi:putative sterol carrier protein